jgi:thiol-disulfide isomerase/thioredoxin
VVSPSPAPLRQLPSRVGQLLVAPRAALSRVELEGGGLRDALWLVVLGVVTFRFPQLFEALLGLTDPGSVGALGRVASVAASEVQQAAWVVLPAAVLVTVAAGRRRDATRDLDLGACAYVPYFLVRGLARAIDAVAGARSLPPAASEVPAVAAAAIVVILAVAVARRRVAAPAAAAPPDPAALAPPEPALSPPAAPPGRAAALAGFAVLAVAGVALAGNAVWSARHMAALRPMRAGAPAPAFALPALDGGPPRSLEELRGRVVVLDFWATWCPPCLAMIPVLDELHAQWGPRGVAFLGVNSDGGGITAAELQAFAREHPMPYPTVVDDGTVNALYKVRALPQLVIIGRDGAVRRTFLGYTTRDTIARALGEAVGP